MSTVSTIPTDHDAHGHGDGHNPHLAHHFDTPEQQIASGKLGMWVFLATEILMFGGLFCAYAVYRHNNPEVFEYAHQWLNKTLGAINTIVLITSSLTMAWGVRLAQLGKQRGLIICLVLTILGGYGFMGIKSIEYQTKWAHKLGVGHANMYRPGPPAADAIPGSGEPAIGRPEEHGGAAEGAKPEAAKPAEGEHHPAAATATPAAAVPANPEYVDPNAGSPDAAAIRPVAQAPAGLAPQIVEEHSKHQISNEQLEEEYDKLGSLDKLRTYTFFQVYFLMTGLHGLHVLVGMALIFWILVKAVPPASRKSVNLMGLASIGLFLIYVGWLVGSRGTWVLGAIVMLIAAVPLAMAVSKPRTALAGIAGEFGPEYFAPVDIVGLYWHLVDLIWIFLFPLLYLIH
jgi:cytochrome c oxidase subunit 3